jgi:hypothetical protein
MSKLKWRMNQDSPLFKQQAERTKPLRGFVVLARLFTGVLLLAAPHPEFSLALKGRGKG